MKDKTRKLVRCIEGHVYDSAAHDACPKCGKRATDDAAPAPANDVESKDESRTESKTESKTGARRKLAAAAETDAAGPEGQTQDEPSSPRPGGVPRWAFAAAAALVVVALGAWASGLLGFNSRTSVATADKKEMKLQDGGATPAADKGAEKKDESAQKASLDPAPAPNPPRPAPASIDDCDRYAMSPLDPDRLPTVSGVMAVSDINAALAVPACEKAVQTSPGERRFWANLGRARRAAKNNDMGAAVAYRQAADLGSLFGSYALALSLRDGTGTQRNLTDARSQMRKAAEGGITPAMVDLASMYELGLGGPRDLPSSRAWLERAVAASNQIAAARLAYDLLDAKGGPANPIKAKQLFEQLILANNTDGTVGLGYMAERGIGTSKDIEAAKAKYLEAAKANNSVGMRRLGALLSDRTNPGADPQEGRRWLTMAAERGDVTAAEIVAYHYYMGSFNNGLPDIVTARQWYEKAASLGSAVSMNWIGRMYFEGNGVTQDYQSARAWFEKAADAGHVAAIGNLGVLSEFGYGMRSPDYGDAWRRFEAAANLGDANAMFHIGQMFEYGKGVKQDARQAVLWYGKGAEAGNSNARWRMARIIDERANNLTPEQYTELANNALTALKSGSPEAREELFNNRARRTSRSFRAAIQEQLTRDGFFDGRIRGEFDRQTLEALQAYVQKK